MNDYIHKLLNQLGPRWWSCNQRSCNLLRRSEFESCWWPIFL